MNQENLDCRIERRLWYDAKDVLRQLTLPSDSHNPGFMDKPHRTYG
jgi:hypothetical protein